MSRWRLSKAHTARINYMLIDCSQYSNSNSLHLALKAFLKHNAYKPPQKRPKSKPSA